ncbi:CBS domain-containing protein [Vitiosangium sp. GDMCC 1.1324]|uniref:CBS domain-containing protein n=1 Tax=Vitiosangium sp. (strain GDMCC 1.1324) TaxID=2138576 RepID=UPI000D37276A|nr:CBS domain-containing protein [Vitiosangium sp. GDMCC 1.1324]PTL84605.1 CBS domain-containing protein [Vitiosangium sp. GDMCC 1.1324]
MKTLKDVMTQDVEVLEPDATLRQAAEMMRQFNIGPVPICEGGRLVGMVTDRDIVVRGLALGHDPNTSTVSAVMTREIEVIHQDASLKEAAALMAANQIRRLPVVDDDENLVGILSLADLTRATSETASGWTLEEISKPSQPAY